jgi:hypothetical protein
VQEVDVGPVKRCVPPIETGDAEGHADPFGAKAAGQSRAGRLKDASIIQPAHGRQPIEVGDFVLVNDKIAVVIEDAGLSDGYGRFGGEIMAVDEVGDDGMPLGVSRYNETLFGVGLTMPDVASVSVMNDGSDGGPAVVRVAGRTRVIPFLEGSLSKLFPSDFDLEVAYDYVLPPGSEKLDIIANVVNLDPKTLDLSTVELFGFFQQSHSQLVTPETGFADPAASAAWAGFVTDRWSFAFRSPVSPLGSGITESGFLMFAGPGYEVEACSMLTSHRIEIIAGGPQYDGLREAIRRVDGDPPWRTITGTVKDAAGIPIAGAWVHELDEDDLYLSRTRTGDDGSYTIHAPPDAPVTLVAQMRGYTHAGTDVADDATGADLTFEPHAVIHVTANDAQTGVRLPVRVQVIPTVELPATPDAFGVLDEDDGRLHQDFAITGETTLVVPPAEHRVVVSRGYEYELHDQTFTIAAGQTVEVPATLLRSVDSTGVMCADFHIHSYQSPDSSDPIDFKVKGAVVDGLEIPVSSEHEWVVDFGPVVESLGLTKWAFGMPSSEFTTFLYGHFGVVPLLPKPGAYNNGAVDWVHRSPAEAFASIDELPEKPALIVNHPRSGIGGFFSASLLDSDTAEPGDKALWSDNFDAVEAFNSSSFDENRDEAVRDWFNLLNRGMRLFAVGSSDSHHLRKDPVGYARTCFYLGHDDPELLSSEIVRDALLSGNSIVSGGIMLTVLGPNGERPGSNVGPGNVPFTVTVESPSWCNAQDLEVIVNGTTVSTETLMPLGAGPSHRYVNTVTLPLERGDWVVFHARGVADLSPLHRGNHPFAVSNPIFVE